MQIPTQLQEAIEKLAGNLKTSELAEHSKTMTHKYKIESGAGKRLITEKDSVASYCAARMPATYAAVYSSLDYTLEQTNSTPKSILDIGAGSGAAAWAANSLINFEKVTCIEREAEMIKAGKFLMQNNQELADTIWINQDISTQKIEQSADLVIASYILNEIEKNQRENFVKNLYEASNDILLIVEPGTKIGFQNILQARNLLISLLANIIAPCPHQNQCLISSPNWCHFSCRLSRSRLHRQIKNADLGYEDEKFCYLAVSKNPTSHNYGRILRHPIINKGNISVELCSKIGIKQKTFSKKDNEEYKKAKKANWGDSFQE